MGVVDGTVTTNHIVDTDGSNYVLGGSFRRVYRLNFLNKFCGNELSVGFNRFDLSTKPDAALPAKAFVDEHKIPNRFALRVFGFACRFPVREVYVKRLPNGLQPTPLKALPGLGIVVHFAS